MSIHFKIENEIATIEFDQPDSKANILSSEVMKKFDAILDEIQKINDLKAVLITSAKKDIFIAGADIKEIDSIHKLQDGVEKSADGQRTLNKLEDLNVPTIAVIDGAALGGGCELALACRYRIATFNDKVRIGLPEVSLGIIPGFAGTYRLPKIIGLMQALRIILEAKVITGQEALKIGLLDRLFPKENLSRYLSKFITEISSGLKVSSQAKSKKNQKILTFFLPLKKVYRSEGLKIAGKLSPKAIFLEQTSLGRSIVFSQAGKNVARISKNFYPAPLKALQVIQQTLNLNRRQALEIESNAFAEMAITPVSKNLVKIFYLREKFRKFLPPGTESISPKPIEKCAVLGAGVMGGGIAQLLSYKRIWTLLKDINFDALIRGLQAARKISDIAVKKRKLKPHERDLQMARILPTLKYSGFKSCHAVIEAVVENLDLKKKIFQELSEQVSPTALLCTNTSALSVTEMAKAAQNPERVVGFHFFNPVHRMPLVEIIKTQYTSSETLASAFGFARQLDKFPILVKDSCGFLVNRILLGYINEAGHILQEGLFDAEAIDKILTDFGMPMGPFELCDEVGLDIGIKVLHILEQSFGERFKPVDLFEKVYAKGFLGKKSKKGFYLYNGKERPPNQEIIKFLSRSQSDTAKKSSDQEECLKRMIYLMINEAARCLEEKVVDEADVIDLAMIMGTGFPPFRGGLIHYARSVGIEAVIQELNKLAEKLAAERFKPNHYLIYLK